MIDYIVIIVDVVHLATLCQETKTSHLRLTMRVKNIPMINDIMREELKIIINEVLDERERRYEEVDDSWLYRGTY